MIVTLQSFCGELLTHIDAQINTVRYQERFFSSDCGRKSERLTRIPIFVAHSIYESKSVHVPYGHITRRDSCKTSHLGVNWRLMAEYWYEWHQLPNLVSDGIWLRCTGQDLGRLINAEKLTLVIGHVSSLLIFHVYRRTYHHLELFVGSTSPGISSQCEIHVKLDCRDAVGPIDYFLISSSTEVVAMLLALESLINGVAVE